MQSQSPSSPPSRHPDSPKRVRPLWIRLLLGLLICIVGLIISAGLVLGYALVVAQPNLPSLDALIGEYRQLEARVAGVDELKREAYSC